MWCIYIYIYIIYIYRANTFLHNKISGNTRDDTTLKMKMQGRGLVIHSNAAVVIGLSYDHSPDVKISTQTLKYRHRKEMNTILQMTLSNSNAFSWMKMIVSWFKFRWNLFRRVQFMISQNCSGVDLVPNRQQVNIWIDDGLVYWRIYASCGPNKLNTFDEAPE